MKMYLIIMFHFIIWSTYSFVEYIAKYDGIKSKIILFLIFCYFAFLLASKIGLDKKKATLTTISTMCAFYLCQQLAWTYIFA